MKMTDIIQMRRSIRCYKQEKITVEHRTQINAKIATIQPLFGAKIRFVLIDKDDINGVKLGTYGAISGASTFLIGIYEKSDNAKLALGYAMEEIILFCTSLGLGTCFLGGTYRKGQFRKATQIETSESIALISPIGYPADNLTLMARLLGSSMKPKSRKEFSSMFFIDSFSQPLASDNPHPFTLPLAMLRLAPSAMNAQPWSALIQDNTIHFFNTHHNYGYGEVDLGIAMCNFALTCQDEGIIGRFVSIPKMQQYNHRGLYYVYSYQKDGL